jgi:hypothetical protein
MSWNANGVGVIGRVRNRKCSKVYSRKRAAVASVDETPLERAIRLQKQRDYYYTNQASAARI